MSCTTILVGRDASYDGSTIIARNEDSPSGRFDSKRMQVIHPADQPRHYRAKISHVELDLPEDPLRYTSVPNADDAEGIWAAAGINTANVAMTATETITSNERVLGTDPLVELVDARRTWSRSCSPTSAPPARGWSVWAACSSATAPTR